MEVRRHVEDREMKAVDEALERLGIEKGNAAMFTVRESMTTMSGGVRVASSLSRQAYIYMRKPAKYT